MPKRKDYYSGNDSEVLSESDIYGEGFFDDMYKKAKTYATTVFQGRNDYPPKVRDIIKRYGDKEITSIIIDRTPVPGLLTGALNLVSFGAFNKKLEDSPYDKLFHLRIDLTFSDKSKIALEKNEVINAFENPTRLQGSEQKKMEFISPRLTLNKLLQGGQKIQGQRWFKYSAYNNNCQDFILALLKGSNIGSEQDFNFIKQDTKQLFKDDPMTRKIANTVTDIGAKVNEITTGSGIEKRFKGTGIYKDIMLRRSYSDSSSDSDSDSDESTISEDEINRRIHKLSKKVKKHMKIHGGKLDIAKSFRKFGDTIKKGFDTTTKYVTAKKGGLASDLLHQGLPAATGALAGTAASIAFPEAGPLAGFAGNQAGKYAGQQLAGYIGSKTGVGLKSKMGDLIHIDIGSHNAKGKSKSGEGLKKRGKSKHHYDSEDELAYTRNKSLSQLVKANRRKEQRELMKDLGTISKDMIAEMKVAKAIRGGGVKGSPEAKERMARIRAMRKTK